MRPRLTYAAAALAVLTLAACGKTGGEVRTSRYEYQEVKRKLHLLEIVKIREEMRQEGIKCPEGHCNPGE